MKKLFICLFVYTICTIHLIFAQKVYLLFDTSVSQAVYASGMLQKALIAQKYSVIEERTGYDFLINIGVDAVALGSEAYVIIPEGKIITVNGGDERGMIYGCLSLAEDIGNGIALQDIAMRSEKPHHALRAIKHNTPWYTYRPSSALDQHYETARDVKYWEAFLDMMAENRFNALSLWNLHPFIYMIKPKNFPEASPFSDEEMQEWQHLHQ